MSRVPNLNGALSYSSIQTQLPFRGSYKRKRLKCRPMFQWRVWRLIRSDEASSRQDSKDPGDVGVLATVRSSILGIKLRSEHKKIVQRILTLVAQGFVWSSNRQTVSCQDWELVDEPMTLPRQKVIEKCITRPDSLLSLSGDPVNFVQLYKT